MERRFTPALVVAVPTLVLLLTGSTRVQTAESVTQSANIPPAASPSPVFDATGQANRQFVKAMELIHQADTTYDQTDEARLLHEADRLLGDIIQRLPESTLAVQLSTNQFVGDFDYYDFRNRVRGLVCNEPQTSLCFLQRIGALLQPMETPVTAARWDWLALAVAYHHLGDAAHAREIIAPFLAAVRRGASAEGAEPDLFVARALALTGETALAIDITRQVAECSTRLYNLSDIAETATWRGDTGTVARLAEEMRTYAAQRGCTSEAGLIAQALLRADREDEARALFRQAIDQQFRARDAKKTCCPPELAVAAAELGDANQALTILREVQDDNPWAIPAVLGRLARRGEANLPQAYAEQVKDLDVRAEAFVELIDAALRRGDRAAAEEQMKRLTHLAGDTATRRPGLMAQRARAEHLLHNDDRWRATFLQAITAAERASSLVRRDIGIPLLTALLRIETGLPMLD